MKKNHPYKKLHRNRAYALSEIARIFGVHIRTTQDWVKKGLPIFNRPSRPYLVMGKDAHQFFIQQRKQLGRRLEDGEFMCLTCHAPRFPSPGSVTLLETEHHMGPDKIQIQLHGECSYCGGKISRLGVQNQKTQKQQSTAPRHFQGKEEPPL
ncbi:MAG: hypothetical protein HQL22_10730 [Candidatus Omnitrophica bacterium]|nr:hypothetical protein [Candidatus Omnitrophota bacterium]